MNLLNESNTPKQCLKKVKKIKKIKRVKRKVSELINHLVPLPFCGVIIPECCRAMKKNRGLYTQCKKLRSGKDSYCSSCLDAARNHSTGKPPYGDIRERDIMKENNMLPGILSYCDVMEKMDITRFEVERDARRLGWKIPDSEWTTSKKKRGRPKKKKKINVFVEDSEDEEETPKQTSKKKETNKTSEASDIDILNMLLARSASA